MPRPWPSPVPSNTTAITSLGAADADELALDKLIAGLRELNAELSVPNPRAYGIAEADWHANLDLMATQALASGSPANNPRVPGHAEIVALYRRVWSG